MTDISRIIELLEKEYPIVRCTLDFMNPLQLLISTQLAAQCTDARVNKTTPALFEKYITAEDYANADISELESIIKPTGFYHNKAKNIIACCKRLIHDFNGIIPDEIDVLTTLPGVGRKTANVILAEVYNKPAVIVDTHAKRLSYRIGLTNNTDPDKIEQDLKKILPSDKSALFCHRLVFHGRQICRARKPACEECIIKNYCKYYINNHVI
ncbi:MAG: endonuclease III [Clostridiaceae bacterium]|nr:endonuclease III [Clostridiaceae bacterium]